MHTALGTSLLGTASVSGATWLALVAAASSVLVVVEAHDRLRRK